MLKLVAFNCMENVMILCFSVVNKDMLFRQKMPESADIPTCKQRTREYG